MAEDESEARIPIVEERARIDKRTVESGLVRIKTSVEERTEWLNEELAAETISIERVPVDRDIESLPDIREEGDVLIIPVVEQRLVIEKRWVLKEELHVRKRTRTEVVDIPVTLRSSKVSVERDRDV